jgi:hypothetical protein
MTDAIDLRTIYPLIVTPSHDGKCFSNYVLSLLNLTVQAERIGMPIQILLHSGESLITRARNNCVATFLADPQYTHLFWIDADIGFSAEAAFRLLSSGYEVSAGIYPLKRDFLPDELPGPMTRQALEIEAMRYTVNTDAPADGELVLEVQPDGFLKLDEAPTGFMVIRRDVFEKMIAAYPDYQYRCDSPGVIDQGLHYRFFDVMVDPVSRRYLSEDFGFCRLWAALGGAIHVDANSSLSHHGYKTYRGDFATSMLDALPYAVGATAGTRIVLKGREHLRPNPPGPQ